MQFMLILTYFKEKWREIVKFPTIFNLYKNFEIMRILFYFYMITITSRTECVFRFIFIF